MDEALSYFNQKISALNMSCLTAGLLPPTVHRECRGHVDKIEFNTDDIAIYGWASNALNIRPSYFFIYDGIEFHKLQGISFISRPDVSKHLGIRNTDLGFRLTIPTTIHIKDKAFELYCSDTSECVGSRLEKNKNL